MPLLVACSNICFSTQCPCYAKDNGLKMLYNLLVSIKSLSSSPLVMVCPGYFYVLFLFVGHWTKGLGTRSHSRHRLGLRE